LTTTAEPAATASYDHVARATHWLIAALAVIIISLGCAIAGALLHGVVKRDGVLERMLPIRR
jgi:cytochrome b561